MSNYLLSDSRKIIYEFGTNVFETHNCHSFRANDLRINIRYLLIYFDTSSKKINFILLSKKLGQFPALYNQIPISNSI